MNSKQIREHIDMFKNFHNSNLNEQSETGKNTAKPAVDPGQNLKLSVVTSDIGGAFKTGDAEPDPTNPKFQALTNSIMDSLNNPFIPKPITVKVRGGASAVGSKGFDNKALADRRAQNTIEYLTQNISRQADVSQVNFEKLPSVVGVATIKDSPEAKAEQFVKVSYPSTKVSPTSGGETAVDKTAISKKDSDKYSIAPPKTDVPVKLMRNTDNMMVPMNKNTFNDINSCLSKYGMFLVQDHLGAKKGG